MSCIRSGGRRSRFLLIAKASSARLWKVSPVTTVGDRDNASSNGLDCMTKRKLHICVFDVNETSLDLRALDPQFAQVFGDAEVRQAWFSQMLQNAFVATITGTYRDFGSLGAAALDMVAARRGVTLTSEDRNAILGGMRRLPPHPEAQGA